MYNGASVQGGFCHPTLLYPRRRFPGLQSLLLIIKKEPGNQVKPKKKEE